MIIHLDSVVTWFFSHFTFNKQPSHVLATTLRSILIADETNNKYDEYLRKFSGRCPIDASPSRIDLVFQSFGILDLYHKSYTK